MTAVWDGTSCKGLLRYNEITLQVLVTYPPTAVWGKPQRFSLEDQRSLKQNTFAKRSCYLLLCLELQ